MVWHRDHIVGPSQRERCVRHQACALLAEQRRHLAAAARCGRGLARLRPAAGRRRRSRQQPRWVEAPPWGGAPRAPRPPPPAIADPCSGCRSMGLDAAEVEHGASISQGRAPWLDPEDFLGLVFSAGFRGDDLEWMDAFERLSCEEQGPGAQPSSPGISSAAFVRLLMDDLARRCQSTSDSLEEMLRLARGVTGRHEVLAAPDVQGAAVGSMQHEVHAAPADVEGEDVELVLPEVLTAQADVERAAVRSARQEVLAAPADVQGAAIDLAWQEVLTAQVDMEGAAIGAAQQEVLTASADVQGAAVGSMQQASCTAAFAPVKPEKATATRLDQNSSLFEAHEEEMVEDCSKVPTKTPKADAVVAQQTARRPARLAGRKRVVQFDPVPVVQSKAANASWGDLLQDVL